jgi:TRAP-type mannitol/chloroaromatic compound transport system permease small subunit
MFYQRIETFIEYTGRAIAWLTLAMVLIMFAVVVLRFVFDIGWIWLQESVNYLHAYVFMLGAAYTLKHDGHVRVDIFYGAMSQKGRSLVDLLGTLLLLMPFCGFIFYVSWDEVIKSWQALESSQQTGGLDFAYLLKTSMLLMPSLLFIQGLAMILRNIMLLRSVGTDQNPEPG